MKIWLVLLLGLSLSSCITGELSNSFYLKPYKAEIPELSFSYFKEGAWKRVYGHGAAYFNKGDPKKFKIRVNSTASNCMVRLVDGDSDITRDCTGKKEVLVDLGLYAQSAQDQKVIGISVFMNNLGIQKGYFYPNVETPIDILPVDYKCPYKKDFNNISVCSRPAGYAFRMKVLIEEDLKGQLLYKYKCNNSKLHEKIYPISGKTEKIFKIDTDTPEYCVVLFRIGQGKEINGYYEIEKLRAFHVRFYDKKYIPLPKPQIYKKSEGWKACAAEEYESYRVNDRDYKKSWMTKQCTKVFSKDIEILVWDNLGRFSWESSEK